MSKNSSEYNKQYYIKNRESIRLSRKRVYSAEELEAKRIRREIAKERSRDYNREYQRKNREKSKLYQKEYLRSIRLKVIEHYGNECRCCGEKENKFLGIDHIENGKGNPVNRKESSYREAIRNNYPDYLQVLCHNCNLAKGFYGKCPHNE